MHTPGPWNIQGMPAIDVRDNDNHLVVTCATYNRPVSEAEANARLIACAPALLQMLRDLVASPSLCSLSANELERAENLICKAEGSY